MHTDELKPSIEDLRAAIARSGQPHYVIGAKAHVNPSRLSQILNGHRPVPDHIALNILEACLKTEQRDG